MILAVALLAKRPEALDNYLLIQERLNISQTYFAPSHRTCIRLASRKGTET